MPVYTPCSIRNPDKMIQVQDPGFIVDFNAYIDVL